jgi:hypothetical protein
MQKNSPLTARDEEILRAVWYYRYITKLDVLHLFFKKTVDTYVGAKLSELSGKTDLDTHNYLCRFNLPAVHKKSQEKVYVLGSRGRRALCEMGLSVDWYFRPHKLKFLSYSYVLHNLILTRTMIAAGLWARHHPNFSLIDKRICYELPGKVVPDGWLLFEEQTPEGVYEHPVIIELDRGMENRHQFRAHVRGRIDYILSGEYQKIFNTDVATIAYATTGQTPEYRETRRKAMCAWIQELLKEMRLESWAGVFRVASVEFPALYDPSLFESEMWYNSSSKTPVRLFG